MKTRQSRWFMLALILTLAGALTRFSYSSSDKKIPKSYRNISAIGHRSIGYQYGKQNWYSLDMEKEVGAQASAAFEKTTALLNDPIAQQYLDHLAKVLAQNSDAQFPITMRVIDSEEFYALTLPGGYQYISRGLLLRVGNECELAAALARGIAHTSLRSATGEQTRANLLKMMAIPLIYTGGSGPGNSTQADLATPLTLLKFSREDESAADYLGVQYLYKSGYASECFITFVRKAWPSSTTKPASKAFSAFPPVEERITALENEIREILPKRNEAITDTNEFANLQGHLAGLPQPKQTSQRPAFVPVESQWPPASPTPSPSPSPR